MSLGEAGAVVMNDPAFAPGGVLANQGITSINDYFDSANAFPSTVSLYLPNGGGSFCTGSLINSRTILTAAHCILQSASRSEDDPPVRTVTLAPIARISFSPNIAAGLNVGISGAYGHANFSSPAASYPNSDIALISLATPVTSVRPVTLLQNGVLLNALGQGTTITMVGYGGYGTGLNPPGSSGPIDGKRRVGQSELVGYDELGGQFFFAAQFRNPQSPNDPDTFELSTKSPPIPTLPLEAGVAQGDSGGPLFACVVNGSPSATTLNNGVVSCAGQWVEIGEVQGGSNPIPGGKANGYGEFNKWTPVNLFSDWLAQNNPLRQVASNAGNFNWSNSAAWTDNTNSAAPVPGKVPNNTDGTITFGIVNDPNNNVNPGALTLGAYYNVTLANRGAITLDISPTIDALAISGAQAQLNLPAPNSLTTVVSTSLSAGTMNFQGGTLLSPEVGITGGVLTGFGMIGSNAIPATGGLTGVCATGVCNSGGIVAPRGVLTINGNYTQTAGGTLSVTAGATSADRLAVTGTASLGGALSIALVPQSGPIANNTTYTILSSGQRSGIFASGANTPLSTFISATTAYVGNNVQLTLQRTETYDQLAIATGNKGEQALATILDTARATGNASPALNTLLGQLDTANTADATTLFDEASGEGTGNSDVLGNHLLANQATSRLINGVIDRHLAGLRDGSTGFVQRAAGLRELSLSYGSNSGFSYSGSRSGVPGPQYAAVEPTATAATSAGSSLPGPLWIQGVGAWQSVGADRNAAGVNQTVGGVVAGIDLPWLGEWSPGLQGGFAFSYTHGDLGGSGSSETGTSDVYRGTLYATQSVGAAYIDGRVAYGPAEMATARSIVIPDFGLGETATGSTGGDQWSAATNVGYRYTNGPYLIEPSLGLAWDRVTRGAYAESNAGALNLAIGDSSLDSLRLSAGARAQAVFVLDDGMQLQPEVRARYVYDALTPAPTTTAALQGEPGVPFTLTGVDIGRNAAVLGAGVTLARADSLAIFVDYNAELRDRETVHAVVGGLRFTW